jgi:hypothetical protein
MNADEGEYQIRRAKYQEQKADAKISRVPENPHPSE